jgi:predicted nucleotide-binding protein
VQKEKLYQEVRFNAEVIDMAARRFIDILRGRNVILQQPILSVDHSDCRWGYDDSHEFLAEYRKSVGCALLYMRGGTEELQIQIQPRATSVRTNTLSRSEIESIFAVFEANFASSRLPVPPDDAQKPVVFIGHGRGGAWRELKDHLQDKHHYKIEAYETGARAGHTIRDVLDDMARKSNFAVLVLTAEDEQLDGSKRARQNVIHECGLFQGRLGFNRAIMLLEDGVEDFSNVAGIQYIKFSKGNIKEVFGEVLATLAREFSR